MTREWLTTLTNCIYLILALIAYLYTTCWTHTQVSPLCEFTTLLLNLFSTPATECGKTGLERLRISVFPSV